MDLTDRFSDFDSADKLRAEAARKVEHVETNIVRTMWRSVVLLVLLSCCITTAAAANPSSSSGTNIFAPESTPARSIFHLSVFVLVITGIIFAVVFTLLVYSISKFRATSANEDREPAQVYGSTQIELAWTIIPTLIVVVLFLATARVLHAV